MRTTTTLFAIGMSAILAGPAFANKPEKNASTTGTAAGTKVTKMTCEEFLGLDDVAKPKLVYWAEGLNQKGKPDEAVFDVERTDQLVPVVIQACTNAPKESFWTKVKQEAKKIF